ncbi:nucleotidyltransferase domain-containing protein, partial [Streptomyces albidoflavus]
MERIEAPYGAWEPASVTEVAALFAPLCEPWWIAGGYAVELAVGRAFRGHADIDVLLLREDQLAAQRALAGWEWWAADPPGTLRPWEAGEIRAANFLHACRERGGGRPYHRFACSRKDS